MDVSRRVCSIWGGDRMKVSTEWVCDKCPFSDSSNKALRKRDDTYASFIKKQPVCEHHGQAVSLGWGHPYWHISSSILLHLAKQMARTALSGNRTQQSWDAALSSGSEICSKSWKAAQLQGPASVWAQWVYASRPYQVELSVLLPTNLRPKIRTFCQAEGVISCQLSENRLELKGFHWGGALMCLMTWLSCERVCESARQVASVPFDLKVIFDCENESCCTS